MAARQYEHLLPMGNEKLMSPLCSYVEGFTPLVPPLGDQPAAARLQHIFVNDGSPATFGHIVAKQWRSDITRGRSTWAVVRKPLEVGLLRQDLVSGGASDVLGQHISGEYVTTSSGDEPIASSGVVIITFQHLIKVLSERLQPAGEDEDDDERAHWDSDWDTVLGNPTFVMNFAFGDMSFEIAFSCPLVAALIEASTRDGVYKPMACTVSNDKRPYFGRAWRGVKTQEISTLGTGQTALGFHGHESQQADGPTGTPGRIERLLSEINSEGSRAGGRTLLLMDPSLLQYLPEGHGLQFADRPEFLRGPGAVEDICLDNKTTYTGQVSGIDEIVILPYADGFSVVRGQSVLCTDKLGVRRSQAEVRYYGSCNQESEPQPRARVLMTHEEFAQLSPHCETSAAHTQDLARLLVCCKLVWPGLAFADMPVLLPSDKHAVCDQEDVLVTMGVLAMPGSGNEPCRGTVLTSLGRTTGMLLKQGVRSVHSAHLLAQLSAAEGGSAALDKDSSATREAILALAILTEINARGETNTSRVVSSVEGRHGDRSWYEDNLKGVAKGKAGRGPIWLALGIWHFLMHNYMLRGTLRWGLSLGKKNPWPSKLLNGGEILIDVERSLRWDRRLEGFNDIRAQLSGEKPVHELGDTPLTRQELLAVEVALVRAFADRIMVVQDHGDTFVAWDMASGVELDRPFPTQEPQVWWDSCRSSDALPGGETSPVFCVYTYLVSALGPDGKTVVRQAADPTHVSARSVRLALEGTNRWQQVRLQLAIDRVPGGGQAR
ncbi:hypothetical protein KVR01_004771 [Diaporthe batatas]|uniref:uncharacterized protein n=1 Tax=Diaporthe batatas TaxID=748121 RepID=UPI001D05AF8D|nr:uncharacterized protein KVR01_004771 [Diaporthe batatas]KAG8166219.1 hypothetical protein KVR01_004771 [Diaporthe batatas]